jgi:hypothetical protein
MNNRFESISEKECPMFTEARNNHKTVQELVWLLPSPARSSETKPFTTADVDGYGDYGNDLAEELLAAKIENLRKSSAEPSSNAQVDPQEFESVYNWFLS